jgi:hypothetical protein
MEQEEEKKRKGYVRAVAVGVASVELKQRDQTTFDRLGHVHQDQAAGAPVNSVWYYQVG